MKQRIKQLVGALDEIIAALVLSFIILLTVSGVFLRYALSRPLPWQEELSLIAMVWLVLIGSSVVARRSGHVRIDTLIRLLPAKQQQVWRCIIHTLVLFVQRAKISLPTASLNIGAVESSSGTNSVSGFLKNAP